MDTSKQAHKTHKLKFQIPHLIYRVRGRAKVSRVKNKLGIKRERKKRNKSMWNDKHRPQKLMNAMSKTKKSRVNLELVSRIRHSKRLSRTFSIHMPHCVRRPPHQTSLCVSAMGRRKLFLKNIPKSTRRRVREAICAPEDENGAVERRKYIDMQKNIYKKWLSSEENRDFLFDFNFFLAMQTRPITKKIDTKLLSFLKTFYFTLRVDVRERKRTTRTSRGCVIIEWFIIQRCCRNYKSRWLLKSWRTQQKR